MDHGKHMSPCQDNYYNVLRVIGAVQSSGLVYRKDNEAGTAAYKSGIRFRRSKRYSADITAAIRSPSKVTA